MALEIYEEVEFVNELNLALITQSKKGWNFRCPFCGDSKKSKYKKRGWLLRDHRYGRDRLVYHCFNCHMPSIELKTMIKRLNPDLFERYLAKEKNQVIEDLKNGELIRKKEKSIPNRIDVDEEKKLGLFTLNPRSFVPARDVLPAVEYARSRLIPEHVIDTLYFCTNKNPKVPWREMLIFPLTKGDKVYGFQGRSIRDKRFNTFSQNDQFKVWGIFDVSLLDEVYIFESIIDAMTVHNSVAMLGASLSTPVLRKISNPVFVFDNDKTGLERALKYAEDGHKVFVWPLQRKEKDFNEVLKRTLWTPDQFKRFIDKNTMEGFSAIATLKMKMR